MNLHMLLILGFALSVTGCAEKEQAAPEQGHEPQTTTPAATEGPAARDEGMRNEAFLRHMHAHAEQLERLNFALADGDLDAAMTPAYWLSRHGAVSGVPSDWQPYLDGMREAARAVEDATNLDVARTAAERITVQCQGCHAAAGVGRERQ